MLHYHDTRAHCHALCACYFSIRDNNDDNDVSFTDFHRWWFLKKYGRPQLHRPCPNAFL
eukprot:COSAG06_NODE_52233_length_307_cov_0.591346_1_plen_58_part_10